MSQQNIKIYNNALDMFMVENCHRLRKLLGNKFNPSWYYSADDREFILFTLPHDKAQQIWELVITNINMYDDYIGLRTGVNPVCLSFNHICDDCFRNNCTGNIDQIVAAVNEEYLDIDFVLSKRWYKKAIQIVTHAVLKPENQNYPEELEQQ